MRWFGKVKVGAPVATTLPAGDIQLPGTTVFVRNAVIAQTGGQYARSVLQHLNEIQGFVVGQAFLAAMSAFGKRQVIVYGGANNNQAAGGGVAAYKRLRRYHDRNENANFAAELLATINASTHTKAWLADQCYHMDLPLWSGAATTSPFRGLPQPARAPRALPRTPVDLAEDLIDTFLAGTALPTRDQMDILCLVLEPWLVNGGGSNTLINYDPHKVVAAGTHRPPQVALFHELVHAYYNAAGGQLGREDSLNEDNGGRLFELMSVGLPPFETRPYSENAFRQALGVQDRTQYP